MNFVYTGYNKAAVCSFLLKTTLMINRPFATLLFLIVSIHTFAQKKHILPKPDQWESESFSFPISFAPGIPYRGTEEVRFSPGWADTASDERWSYCFLWWVSGESSLNMSTLKKYLEEYYDGLVRSNLDSTAIARARFTKTHVIVSTGNSASKPFTAEVSTLDYMTKKALKLNVDVYTTNCTENKMKGFFFAVSPQPHFHRIWKQLERIWDGFECGR